MFEFNFSKLLLLEVEMRGTRKKSESKFSRFRDRRCHPDCICPCRNNTIEPEIVKIFVFILFTLCILCMFHQKLLKNIFIGPEIVEKDDFISFISGFFIFFISK